MTKNTNTTDNVTEDQVDATDASYFEKPKTNTKMNRMSFKPYKLVGFDGENEIESEHKFKKPVLKLYNLKLKVKTNTFVEPNTFHLDKDDQEDQADIEAIIDELVEELTSEMMDNIREAVKDMVESLVVGSDPYNNTVGDGSVFIKPFGNVSQSNYAMTSIDRLFSRKPKVVGLKKIE